MDSRSSATDGTEGEQSVPLFTKVIFTYRLKPMRKIGVWEWRHQPYSNFNKSMSQVVFKDRI